MTDVIERVDTIIVAVPGNAVGFSIALAPEHVGDAVDREDGDD